MNQSIQFNDGVEWQESEQRLFFTAQAYGMAVNCYFGRHRLELLSGQELRRSADILFAFEQHRFEVEELAELKIAAQEFAEDGSVYLD